MTIQLLNICKWEYFLDQSFALLSKEITFSGSESIL